MTIVVDGRLDDAAWGSAGRSALTLDDPDFTVHELTSNAVRRWEYFIGR